MRSFSLRTYAKGLEFFIARAFPSLILTILTSSMLIGCSDRDPSVPDVTLHKTEASAELPTLHVAVAAMISPEATRDLYEDLIQHVANEVGRRPVFLQRRSYSEVNALIKNREVDVAFVCSSPYVKGHDEFGLELLVVPVVHRNTVYHSYTIVPSGSEFESFIDLKGHRFAFTDRDSNTGFMAPSSKVAEFNQTTESFFSDTFFTNSHDASITAVATGLADGAAVDSLIWELFAVRDPELTSKTRIIDRSEPFGIPPVVVHPDCDKELKTALRETFLHLASKPETAQILSQLQIDRFTLGADSDYNSVRQIQHHCAGKTDP